MKSFIITIIAGIFLMSCNQPEIIHPSITYAPDSNAISIIFDKLELQNEKDNNEIRKSYSFSLPMPFRSVQDTPVINQLRIHINKTSEQSVNVGISINDQWESFDFGKGIIIEQDSTLEFTQKVSSEKTINCQIRLKGTADLLTVDTWDIGKVK